MGGSKAILPSFLQVEDNFAKYKEYKSVCIYGDETRAKPQYTIFIPTFRRGRKILRAVESALQQDTYVPYDVIVVDNEPDSTLGETDSLMKELCANHENLRYYRNEKNIGACGNWNRAIELCKSEWCCMLHDDDLLLPNYVETIVHATAHYSFDELHIERVNLQEYNKWDRFYRKCAELRAAGGRSATYIGLSYYKYGAVLSPCGAVFHRSAMLKCGGFDEGLSPCFDYGLQLKNAYYGRLLYFHAIAAKYNLEDNDTSRPETKKRLVAFNTGIRCELQQLLKHPYTHMEMRALCEADERALRIANGKECEGRVDRFLMTIVRKVVSLYRVTSVFVQAVRINLAEKGNYKKKYLTFYDGQ